MRLEVRARFSDICMDLYREHFLQASEVFAFTCFLAVRVEFQVYVYPPKHPVEVSENPFYPTKLDIQHCRILAPSVKRLLLG